MDPPPGTSCVFLWCVHRHSTSLWGFPNHSRKQTAETASDEAPAWTFLLATQRWSILSNETYSSSHWTMAHPLHWDLGLWPLNCDRSFPVRPTSLAIEPWSIISSETLGLPRSRGDYSSLMGCHSNRIVASTYTSCPYILQNCFYMFAGNSSYCSAML